MVTSAMLARAPGCPSPPASRRPSAPSAARSAAGAAAAPDPAQSQAGSARGPGGQSGPPGKDWRQRRRETGPGAAGWRPSCPATATCSRAPGPDRYQIPRARKWTRAGQYGGREETERPAGGQAGLGGEGEGNCRSVTAIASGWRVQIGSRGRLPAVSFVPSDARPRLGPGGAPAPAPCLPPDEGSRLSVWGFVS
nr:uncharacterized protein LOC115855430 [Globicephala melas]XP_030716563.1 uncharacterized protein LOC115855430 [Globicephala melas]XP_030716568.1 uncharacterized protein LOC115855430 [Globicephala melas]